MFSVLLGLIMTVAPQPAGATAPETCCFTNPSYTGVCKVVTDENTTCADVLAYLNNPQSVGRTYCDNTTVRGGWKQVTCEEKEAASSDSACSGAPAR